MSIEDIEAFSSKVKVFPNPANASVTISYDRTLGTINDYNIIDLQGRVILSNHLKGLDNSIDVSLMNSGVYLLSFNTVDGNTFTKKIIKN